MTHIYWTRRLFSAAVAFGFGVMLFTSPAKADLIGYWPFNDPDTPDTVVDVSGRGNNGVIDDSSITTYTGDAGGRTGLPGDTAIDLGDFNNGAAVNLSTIADENDAFDSILTSEAGATVAFWMFRDQDPQSQWTFYFGDGGERQFSSHAPWGDGNLYFDVGGCCGGDDRISGALDPSVLKDAWTQITYRLQDGTSSVWVNGVKFLESDPANTVGFNRDHIDTAFIGAGPGAGNSQSGLIDDFAIFDHALSDIDINLLGTGASNPLDIVGGAVEPGDFNKDGTIDLADYDILVSNFAGPGSFVDGDMNFSGRIDLKDFAAFVDVFAAAGAGAAVPEPATGVLALIGVLGMLFVARKSRK